MSKEGVKLPPDPGVSRVLWYLGRKFQRQYLCFRGRTSTTSTSTSTSSTTSSASTSTSSASTSTNSNSTSTTSTSTSSTSTSSSSTSSISSSFTAILFCLHSQLNRKFTAKGLSKNRELLSWSVAVTFNQ